MSKQALAEKVVGEIRRKTRRKHSTEEEIRIERRRSVEMPRERRFGFYLR